MVMQLDGSHSFGGVGWLLSASWLAHSLWGGAVRQLAVCKPLGAGGGGKQAFPSKLRTAMGGPWSVENFSHAKTAE